MMQIRLPIDVNRHGLTWDKLGFTHAVWHPKAEVWTLWRSPHVPQHDIERFANDNYTLGQLEQQGHRPPVKVGQIIKMAADSSSVAERRRVIQCKLDIGTGEWVIDSVFVGEEPKP